MVVQIFLRRKAHQTDSALETIHFGLRVRAQVDAIVVYLAEALPTLCTAVWACSCVEVHVIVELELGGQMLLTHAAPVVT